ncbi:ATP-binding protein [Rhizobium acaciae]|uniref:ATP-binding protein n=1 Tax=Rhizobium acaciae TaxID=2989736 RepID=UPI003F9CAC68
MKKELTLQDLHFDVSSGLKSVLGSDLITDDEVAIFELVKNSFDAEATRVDIVFDDGKILIADNGTGMSYDDIRNKWLFVAYSAKKDVNRQTDFRDSIAERKNYAGSKGIGRFSSDRLGSAVRLQTLPVGEAAGRVHSVYVNWARFDENHKTHFGSINVTYSQNERGFDLPEIVPALDHGTVITVEGTRQNWDREKILQLKSALAKLINPFGAMTDGFKIFLHAWEEAEGDEDERNSAYKRNEEPNDAKIVNGEVGNFIFSALAERTTSIEVVIDGSQNTIETTLVDRGELIYRIREPNPYNLLRPSGFRCQIFFLNHSAKMTFARRMGVPSVQFGSVFVFRNSFRVYPIGEEGDDWFQMDRRKQQGYARFLGTRDVIGRLDVSGPDVDFQEASSRNTGLIETAAVAQLKKCFRDHCLIRLEKYVVPVTFVDSEDKNFGDVSRLMTDPGRARVANAVAKLVDDKDVELLEYSTKLIGILSERSSQFENSLTSLRAIAEKTKDRELFSNIEQAERRFEEMRLSEERARRQADEERRAKEAALKRASDAERIAETATVQLTEEKKRNLFLTSVSALDMDTILNLHHQVTMYAVDVQQRIENFVVSLEGKASVSRAEVVAALDGISLLNRRIMGVAKFATKANFRLESEKIEADIGEYIEQYINQVAKDFLSGPMSLSVARDGKSFSKKFKPIDVAVVVDNLISNARKARATKINFEITHPAKDTIHVRIDDNGRGFDPAIGDTERIFEKGFTKTDGSGLGLYHVQHVLGEMNGTIEVVHTNGARGAAFLIRIAR